MSGIVGGVLWQRIDRPGHDLCRLLHNADGWYLSGHAISDEGAACSLSYEVCCDPNWVTRSARVSGSIDQQTIAIEIDVDNGRWSMDGKPLKHLDGLVDLDLGFTPATNILPIRRLPVTDHEVTTRAAWLPFPDLVLRPLDQIYRRIDADNVAYASPAHDFEATLTLAGCGLVLDYPGLWTGREIAP